MADYLSKYTGQQIDNILDAVGGKLNKTDVVNDIMVDDDLSPASAHLTFVLKSAIDTMNDVLANKVVRDRWARTNYKWEKVFCISTECKWWHRSPGSTLYNNHG